MNVFKCGKYSLKLGEKTYVMGILNVTPDSFSDGGKWLSTKKAVERALEMEKEGADILDIGAQSTRPGHIKISPDDELERLIPVLEEIKGKLRIPVSVDTFYAKVADEVLPFGVDIINDVYGFEDEDNGLPSSPQLAQSYVPFQIMNRTFRPCVGLQKGTIFPELVSPYEPCQSVAEIDYIKANNEIKGGCNDERM